MARCIILVGLPGSGKSTYAEDYVQDHIENTVAFSSDGIRKVLYGDESIQGDASKVFRKLHERTAMYLQEGLNVVYDATNVNRKSRKEIIKLAKSIPNVTVECHIIWAPYEDCIKRDSLRNRTVGEQVIKKFLYRWETPYYNEGIDTIRIIHNVNDEFSYKDYCTKLRDAMNIPHDNPHHTLGVWEHCVKSMELMHRETRDIELWRAMCWHDVGKPMTKFYKTDSEGNPVGHAHYYNHDNVGGYLTCGITNPENSNYLLNLSWLVNTHMQPFFNSKYYNNLDKELKDKIDLIHKCDVNAH